MKSLCLAVLILFGLATTPAVAETMEWTMTSDYPYQVQVVFYSATRSAAWPGNGKAYDINDYAPHTYSLNCRTGEKVCYGAWPTGGDSSGQFTTWWGVGQNNKRCSDCCAVCGDENPVKRLVK